MTGGDLAFVCLMGMGTVFFGLICIIVLISLVGKVCNTLKNPEVKEDLSSVQTVNPDAPISNKEEIIAGACAVIAEELGEDVSNIKVTSFKKL